jgi:hypothetical protein
LENSQKIRKYGVGAFWRAKMYFKVVCSINEIKISDRDLDFISFLASEGDNFSKKRFSEAFNMDLLQINSIVYNLRNAGLLLKDKRFPELPLVFTKVNFNNSLTLNILLDNETS